MTNVVQLLTLFKLCMKAFLMKENVGAMADNFGME
jgi:hypothetical protein